MLTTLILVHWKLSTKLNVESYFCRDFHVQYTVYLKYLAISDETWTHPIWIYIWNIIITTITTIITIITIIITITPIRITPNKILGTGDLFCGPSHHHCHPAGVPCLGALGFEVRILERGEGDVRSLGLGIWQGWFRMTQTQFLQTFWIGPKWDFRVCSVIFGIHLQSNMDECCAHIFSAVFGWDNCRKWHTRKDKMWLAALNMPGFSYQTDEMILPIDFHILGPRVAQNLVSFHLILLGCIQFCRPLFHLQ